MIGELFVLGAVVVSHRGSSLLGSGCDIKRDIEETDWDK